MGSGCGWLRSECVSDVASSLGMTVAEASKPRCTMGRYISPEMPSNHPNVSRPRRAPLTGRLSHVVARGGSGCVRRRLLRLRAKVIIQANRRYLILVLHKVVHIHTPGRQVVRHAGNKTRQQESHAR